MNDNKMTRIPLSQYPKSSTFLKLKADPVIPTIEAAQKLYNSGNQQEITKNFNKPRTLKSGAYQFTIPEPRPSYKHLLSSPNALDFLSLPLDSPSDPYYKSLVSSETFYHDDKIWPYAQAYAGFQFGQFAGQLGDGRVSNLFTLETPKNGKQELQLKGAGKTAFSRFADGKAVLRSSIREFIISESLAGIGIPSTRALSISLLPDTKAQRERAEVCAVVARFAKSWLRLGTFDLYRWRQDREGLRKLCDYIIEDVLDELPSFKPGQFEIDEYKEYTEGEEEHNEDIIKITDSSRYDQMYRAIVNLNAKTVAYWQSYGFLNGVLNTDNTSIIGLSIDFGPFSFMDKFDPTFTPNHDDVSLRYSFANQPSIIWWNLTRLGESLVELLGAGPDLVDDEFFMEKGIKKQQQEQVIKRVSSIIHLASIEYKSTFMKTYNSLMTQRIGLKEYQDGDNDLIAKLLEVIGKTKVDFNKFFTKLQESKIDDISPYLTVELKERMENPQDKVDKELNQELTDLIQSFIESYKKRLGSTTDEERFTIASKVNPQFTPRNWMLEEVIEQMYEDPSDVSQLSKLLKMSSNPYNVEKWGDESKELESHWIGEEGKTMIQCSCSS